MTEENKSNKFSSYSNIFGDFLKIGVQGLMNLGKDEEGKLQDKSELEDKKQKVKEEREKLNVKKKAN